MDVFGADVIPTEGGGIEDLISNPAISTPAGFALAVLMYLAKLWRDSRTERRADNDQRQTRESHIVDETKDILTTRREEAADLRQQARLDRQTIRAQELIIHDLEDKVARLRRNNQALLEQSELLRETLRDGIGQKIEDRTARAKYTDFRNATDRTDPAITGGGEDRPLPGPRTGGTGAHRRGAG